MKKILLIILSFTSLSLNAQQFYGVLYWPTNTGTLNMDTIMRRMRDNWKRNEIICDPFFAGKIVIPKDVVINKSYIIYDFGELKIKDLKIDTIIYTIKDEKYYKDGIILHDTDPVIHDIIIDAVMLKRNQKNSGKLKRK